MLHYYRANQSVPAVAVTHAIAVAGGVPGSVDDNVSNPGTQTVLVNVSLIPVDVSVAVAVAVAHAVSVANAVTVAIAVDVTL